jgi:hypothetical protein
MSENKLPEPVMLFQPMVQIMPQHPQVTEVKLLPESQAAECAEYLDYIYYLAIKLAEAQKEIERLKARIEGELVNGNLQ